MRRFERTAAHAFTEFTRAARAQILGSRQTDYVFPTRRGDRMTRPAFWHIIRRYQYPRALRAVENADPWAAPVPERPLAGRRAKARASMNSRGRLLEALGALEEAVTPTAAAISAQPKEIRRCH